MAFFENKKKKEKKSRLIYAVENGNIHVFDQHDSRGNSLGKCPRPLFCCTCPSLLPSFLRFQPQYNLPDKSKLHSSLSDNNNINNNKKAENLLFDYLKLCLTTSTECWIVNWRTGYRQLFPKLFDKMLDKTKHFSDSFLPPLFRQQKRS